MMNNLKVMSFNIRIDLKTDRENSWNKQKQNVFALMKEETPEIIGFQEVNPNMYKELKRQLSKYLSFGIGRDYKHETVPIFIKKSTFDVIDHKTLWLSETPTLESKIADSHFPRIVTCVVLAQKLKE